MPVFGTGLGGQVAGTGVDTDSGLWVHGEVQVK